MRALLRFNMRTSRLLAAVASVLLVAGCSLPSLPIATNIPYTASWSGTATSDWLNLRAGSYDVDIRMSPPGCASRIQLVGRNEYPVVPLWPEFVPHVVNPPPPASTQWTGFSSQLVAGSYRFEGTAPAACLWWARITRNLSNLPAQAGKCSWIATLPNGSIVKITGKRVPLPSDSALGHDSQLVEPDNVPMSHFGIGIDDGTALCAVLWPPGPATPLPRMGERVTFTGQVIADQGKPYLGITSHP